MTLNQEQFADLVGLLKSLDQSQLPGLLSNLGECHTRVLASGDIKLSIRFRGPAEAKKHQRREKTSRGLREDIPESCRLDY